jgi:hypothetical protein
MYNVGKAINAKHPGETHGSSDDVVVEDIGQVYMMAQVSTSPCGNVHQSC